METCIQCKSNNIKKNGYFEVNGIKVPKFQCKDCKCNFSPKSELVEKGEKRPELNEDIVRLFLEGHSQREIAKMLDCARRTVQVKLKKYLEDKEANKPKDKL